MNVFGRNRPPGPRACNANMYGLRRLILIHGEGGNININAEYASAKVVLGVENPTKRSCGKRQVPRVDLMKSEMVI